MQGAAGEATLVGPPERYGHLGYRVLADAVVGIGPLGGLVTALETADEAWSLVLTCDMPAVSSRFLEFLADHAGDDCDAVVPRQGDGRPQPLCACYRSAAAPVFRRAADDGIYKLRRVLDGLRVRWIEPDEWAAFDPDGHLFANINRPGDLDVFSGRSDTLKN